LILSNFQRAGVLVPRLVLKKIKKMEVKMDLIVKLKEVRQEYRRAYEELAEAGEGLNYWYFYLMPVDKSVCDICESEVGRGHFLIEIFDIDLGELVNNGLEGMFMDIVVCDFCLEKVRIYQRDFLRRDFWEEWKSTAGVDIVCLWCGWRGFVYASWDSYGGLEVVEEWVGSKESEHRRACDY
jgi:hypothetical protein